MLLQYISDNAGHTTGVFIPIEDWNVLVRKFDGLEKEVDNTIPQWHKDILDKRLSQYLSNSLDTVDFETACNELENEL